MAARFFAAARVQRWLDLAFRKRRLRAQARTVRASGLFDEEWYLRTYPEVARAGADPVAHYLEFGVSEGRDPSTQFNTRWYLDTYADVAGAGMNPLLHYIRFGRGEKRRPIALPEADKALKQSLEEQSRLATERKEQAMQLQAELETLVNAEARLRQELAEARQTASLSTKLQALREADLKDLQGRYEASLSIQESQHQVLVKLGERLRAVAGYFHEAVERPATPLPGIEEKSRAGARKAGRSRPAGRRSGKS